MSISSQITRILSAKDDIKTSIENKGVTIPSSAKLDDYSSYIDQISAGGGSNLLGLIDGTATSFSDSSIETIRECAFYFYSTLRSIDIPNVKTIGAYAFFNTALNSDINLPKLEGFYKDKMSGSPFASTKITSFTAPLFKGNVTNGVYDYTMQQFSVTSLRTVYAPLITKIGQSAFTSNNYMTSAVFSKQLDSIGAGAFAYCSSLTSFDCGITTSLSGGSFSGCSKLVSLTFRSSTVCALTYPSALASSSHHVTIYVPSNLITSYQEETNWSTLYNNGYITFMAIEE